MDNIKMMNLADKLAEELYGEFGFSTCHSSEQETILEMIKMEFIMGGQSALR